VHALDNVFGRLHQQIRVKRGSLFSLDDAKNNDLIFIGSPSENLTLLELPNTRIHIQTDHYWPRRALWKLSFSSGIGEPKEFLRLRLTRPDGRLFGHSAKARIDPTHSVLILAGATPIERRAPSIRSASKIHWRNYFSGSPFRIQVSSNRSKR